MTSLAKFGENPIVSFGDIPLPIFCNYFSRAEMDQTTSNSCCFCHKTFKSLGNHYKGCPERKGECYQHLLSKKTLAKRQYVKAKKAPCPKCGKMFLRLETHLRTNAACRSVTLPSDQCIPPTDPLPSRREHATVSVPSTYPSFPTSIVSPTSPHPTSSFVSPPSSHHTNSIVPSPSPHHTNSIVSPPPPHHTNSTVVLPSPHPTNSFATSPSPHHTNSFVSSPSPHHANSFVSPTPSYPASSVVQPNSTHLINSVVPPVNPPQPLNCFVPPFSSCHTSPPNSSIDHVNSPSSIHHSSAPYSPHPPQINTFLVPPVNLPHNASPHTCSSTPSQHPHTQSPHQPVLHNISPAPVLLPRVKLPSTQTHWDEVDNFVEANIAPVVVSATDVNVMHNVITQELYKFMLSRFGESAPYHHRHHHNGTQLPPAKQQAIQLISAEKKEAKRKLRKLRKGSSSPEEVRSLASQFHRLIRQHCKLVNEAKKLSSKASAKMMRKDCRRNIHKFARHILDNDNCSSIQPSFSKEEAEAYFSRVYSTTARSFHRPEWMPECPPPSSPMSTDPFTEEELRKVITNLKSSSAPSPTDQISYEVIKRCPSLFPALLHMFNRCWMTQSTPTPWKVGIIRLQGKMKAQDDPTNPSNFRPIALTSCISKVFTSLVKRRWLSYMLDNNYLNTATQKAFIDGVPGCSEHHLKLLSILREAQRRHKSLSVCWLDLANAFGSVHHDLITFSLAHYHAPPEMISLVSNLYDGLTAVISSKSWTTNPIQLQLGVYQGDPLSVIIFNTVMNTLVDSIVQRCSHLGYTLNSYRKKINLLQYADDTSLIGDGPASCQHILSLTESWLSWSGMRANVPKCVCLAIKASTGKPYNPKLTLSGEPIPYLGDTTFRFLGAPVAIHSTSAETKDHLIAKLSSMLQKVDATPITRQQKLKLFKVAILPRLTWDLSISHLAISWLQNTLQPIATRYLKKWSGLAKSADPNRLFLPKSNGGLELPHLVTTFKKVHAAKAGSHMCSRDPAVRAIASEQTIAETNQQRASFRPHLDVVDVMKTDPGATKRHITSLVKSKIQAEDTSSRLAHTNSLAVQGFTTRVFDGSPAQNWSTAISSLPEWCFKFALNAVTDTLPHNLNLFRWKKLSSPKCQLCGQDQSLSHVLNSCKTALELRRFNTRHDDVLRAVYDFSKCHLPSGMRIIADLPNLSFCFPQDIALTDQRPDMVIWSSSTMCLIELTIPYETNIGHATARKIDRYRELKTACSRTHRTQVITLEVGSRGFINTDGFQDLYRLLKPKASERRSFECDVIGRTITGSYNIWCKRNWLG